MLGGPAPSPPASFILRSSLFFAVFPFLLCRRFPFCLVFFLSSSFSRLFFSLCLFRFTVISSPLSLRSPSDRPVGDRASFHLFSLPFISFTSFLSSFISFFLFISFRRSPSGISRRRPKPSRQPSGCACRKDGPMYRLAFLLTRASRSRPFTRLRRPQPSRRRGPPLPRHSLPHKLGAVSSGRQDRVRQSPVRLQRVRAGQTGQRAAQGLQRQALRGAFRA